MISGGVMVFVWKYGISLLGGAFAIYELLPAFIVSCIMIVAVSLATAEPSADILRTYDEVNGIIRKK
jgi:sodium/proline symporter